MEMNCKELREKRALKATELLKRRIEWEAQINGEEAGDIGEAVEKETTKRFKKRIFMEVCFGHCKCYRGLLLGKGDDEKCELMAAQIFD